MDGASSAVSGMVAGGEEATSQITGLFSSAKETLGGITDVDSATAAVPALTDMGGKLDGITSMVDKLPDAAKGPVSSMVEKGMGELTPMLDKVMAIPGVGGVLGSVIEPMKEKLTALAGG